MALFTLALTLSLASAAQPIVTVTGGTECPTRAEVTARLGEWLSRRAIGDHGDVAELREDGATIRVTLRSAAGNVIGQRRLPRTFSCADLADAIGVVLETWETDIHPEFKLDAPLGAPLGAQQGTGKPIRVSRGAPGLSASSPAARSVMEPVLPPTLPMASGSTEPASPVPGSTPPSPLPSPLPSPSPSPSPFRPAPVLVHTAAPVTPRETALATPGPRGFSAGPRETVARADPAAEGSAPASAIELLAGALGGLAQPTARTDTRVALGARIGVGWSSARIGRPRGSEAWRRVWPDAWGVELGFLAASERSTVLPSGTAEWRRDVLALGPRLRWALGSAGLTMELHAEALGARLNLRGSGFAANGGGQSFEPGFGAGARLLFGRARLQTWIDLRFADWVVSEVVYEQPSGQSEALPRLEGLLSLGVSWTVRP